MALPIINFKFTGVEVNEELQDLVTNKFESLERFFQEDSTMIEVEFNKEAEHQSGRVFRCEANVSIKGALYRAEATEESFGAAVDEVRAELDKELTRSHDKMITQRREGARQAKEMLQNGDV